MKVKLVTSLLLLTLWLNIVSVKEFLLHVKEYDLHLVIKIVICHQGEVKLLELSPSRFAWLDGPNCRVKGKCFMLFVDMPHIFVQSFLTRDAECISALLTLELCKRVSAIST